MEKHLIEQVDALFTTWDRDDSPGCVLGLIRDGEMIYAHGYGMANLEYGIPITPDTIFYIASTSKQFTAACILLLAQNGLLSLQDDIRKYLPEMPAYAQPVKIEHLIHHASGLREHGVLSELAGLCPLGYRTADAVALICRQRGVNYPAGESHLYNNAGYVLQAEIVERISGQPFSLFVKNNIFDPLGMQNTLFGDDCSRIVCNRAASYELAAGGGYRHLLMTNNVLGSAGVMTTVQDLFLWDQNFYHPRVGGEAFIRQMQTQGQLSSGEKIGYSMGLMHGEVCGLRTIFHTGTEFGFRSIMMRFPEAKFTIISLSNLATFSPGTIVERIAEIFFAGNSPVRTGPPESEAKPQASFISVEECVGFYFDPESGAFLDLSLREGQLFTEVMGVPVPLTIADHKPSKEKETVTLAYSGKLLSMPLTIELERKDRQSPWNMQVAPGSCCLPVLQSSRAAKLDENALADYAGVYYSSELKAVYEFRVADGKLVTAHLRGLQGSLSPGPADLFTLDGLSLCFTRNENRRVNGFRLWEMRARGIEFIRSNL